jgi:hypothetical protein
MKGFFSASNNFRAFLSTSPFRGSGFLDSEQSFLEGEQSIAPPALVQC